MSRRLTQAELAAERRLTLKCWVMLTLPPDEVGAILLSSSPPTVAELIARARQYAAQFAGRCAHCGEPLPVDPATKEKPECKPIRAPL